MENVIDKGTPRTGSAGIDVEKILGPSPLKKWLKLFFSVEIVPAVIAAALMIGGKNSVFAGFLVYLLGFFMFVAGVFCLVMGFAYFVVELPNYNKAKRVLLNGTIRADFAFNPRVLHKDYVAVDKVAGKFMINGEILDLNLLKETRRNNFGSIGLTLLFREGEKPAREVSFTGNIELQEAELQRFYNYLGWS